MKVTINKTDFLNLTKNVFDIGKKINNNIYLTINGKANFINLSEETIIKVSLHPIGETINGECIIPIKLYDIVKTLPVNRDDTITLYKENDNICILYANNITKLPINDITKWKEQFKTLSTFVSTKINAKFTIDPNLLLQMASMVVFATTSMDYRYSLTGILIELFEDKIRLAAGDGYRIAISDFYTTLPPEIKDTKYIISKKLFTELKKITKKYMKEATITISKTHIGINLGDISINSKLIDDTFPDYTKNLPVNSTTPITINSTELNEKMKKVDTLKIPFVTLNVNTNVLELSAQNESGEIKESLPCIYNGLPLLFRLDTKHLIEYLLIIKRADIEIHCTTSEYPVMIKLTKTSFLDSKLDYNYVISPVKL
jgi:DNA polymerase III subunit beta